MKSHPSCWETSGQDERRAEFTLTCSLICFFPASLLVAWLFALICFVLAVLSVFLLGKQMPCYDISKKGQHPHARWLIIKAHIPHPFMQLHFPLKLFCCCSLFHPDGIIAWCATLPSNFVPGNLLVCCNRREFLIPSWTLSARTVAHMASDPSAPEWAGTIMIDMINVWIRWQFRGQGSLRADYQLSVGFCFFLLCHHEWWWVFWIFSFTVIRWLLNWITSSVRLSKQQHSEIFPEHTWIMGIFY